MALLCKADGRSVIKEKIFENRFTHIGELKRLGAKISVIKNKAIIAGNSNLEGAELMSSDLRASVALVIAAIVSKGNALLLDLLCMKKSKKVLKFTPKTQFHNGIDRFVEWYLKY